ncbi:DUF3850 domain-containing protein [Lactococcus raffinolactis]|uniref:DUF3850 domain-containing protein n=1 Tax=Pseudolactococcus raffinolactis TaxID=1366 RepID=UPI001436AFC9|nr:DUF3850 domain-containing protein [Lactococcus raffinolactis]QIW50765.1 DUF3850 domain-containing protein [Lactococcus raffinolactis]
MKTHELKLDTKYFDDVKSGKKDFEIRKNDRDFEVGDILELKKYKSYKNGKKPHYVMTDSDSVLKTYNSDRADTIKVKVKSIIKAESWNMDKNFTDPLIFEGKMIFKYGISGVSKVLKDYFGSEYVPDGYVVMKIEVVPVEGNE